MSGQTAMLITAVLAIVMGGVWFVRALRKIGREEAERDMAEAEQDELERRDDQQAP